MPDISSKVHVLKDAPKAVGIAKPRPWYQWFEDSDTPEERRLIWKLDLIIVGYAVIIYYVKNLDQSNINNSYVSGMSADLNFHGNQLVQFQTMYIVGAAVFQLPFMYLFTRVPMNIMIPTLDVLWGLVTLIQYRTQSYGEMMAYRFLVGVLEASFFPAIHWVLGSWYRRDEIGRRGGVFYLGLSLGQLTAGLLQASIIEHLEGHLGLRAWRWNFIIAGCMTIPIGFAGYFIWPGTPDRAWSLFLTKEEILLAKTRLEKSGHVIHAKNPMNLAKFKSVFKGWKVYVLTLWAVLFWNTSANSAAYLLWLKSVYGSTGPALVHANNLSTTAPAVGFVLILAVNFGADMFRSQWGAITFANSGLLIGLLILAAGGGSKAGHFVAFNLMPFSYSQSSTLYGWSNSILRRDQEERAIVLIVMNTVAQSSTAWIGLLTYPTVEGPRFLKGFIFSSVITACQIGFTQVVRYLSNRDELYYAELDEARSLAGAASVDEKEGDDALPLPPAGFVTESKA